MTGCYQKLHQGLRADVWGWDYVTIKRLIEIIWTIFDQFKTSTLFPKFWKNLLPLAFSLTCLLTLCSLTFQSAYRIFHSAETTLVTTSLKLLLKIHNYHIHLMDRGEVTLLILFNLSAAFDTVDHSILLTLFQNWFGLDGLFLNWFSSISHHALSLHKWFQLAVVILQRPSNPSRLKITDRSFYHQAPALWNSLTKHLLVHSSMSQVYSNLRVSFCCSREADVKFSIMQSNELLKTQISK